MMLWSDFARKLCGKALPILLGILVGACSPDKFLKDDDSILQSVRIRSDSKAVEASSYEAYIRQRPNTKWFNILKAPLALYSLSGLDTTKRSSRFWRRLGEAPVIYNEDQTQNTCAALSLALKDKGFLQGTATAKIVRRSGGKRTRVEYTLHPNSPYIISNITRQADNKEIDSIINADAAASLLQPGMLLDAATLDKERSRIVSMLRNNGRYRMLKNYIHYDVDTLDGPARVNLHLFCDARLISGDSSVYDVYYIDSVRVNDDVPLRHSFLKRKMALKNGNMFRESDANLTYRTLMNMEVISYVSIKPTIHSKEKTHTPDSASAIGDSVLTGSDMSSRHSVGSTMPLPDAGIGKLDEDISILMRPINTFGIEVEGTNTAGNLGAAVNLLYTNRNLFRGAEVWTTKLHGAYEAISGLEGYSDQNYFELGIETKLTFPSLLVPFRLLGRREGSSAMSLQWNTQERPEFHRRVLTALWSYQWATHSNRVRERLDIPSLNYVYMPWISNTFRHDYLEATSYRSALIRYAYEDLLIFNVTYSHQWASGRSAGTQNSLRPQSRTPSPTLRLLWSVESAGNLLWALSKPMGLKKNDHGYYKLFDVAYAQYLKLDIDASASFPINRRNSLALHGSMGVAQPYGNSLIVPFEKRYFGGGANGIRGWSVRELGPGNYKGEDGRVDFINQTGNLKLLLQAELRSLLFWKLSGAFFLDAGNIWTTRCYAVTGRGGRFSPDRFWKQVAASWGVGMRLNLDYFILRFDLGVKAVNPAYSVSSKRYLPLIHPRIGRDCTLHFAVGLPF